LGVAFDRSKVLGPAAAMLFVVDVDDGGHDRASPVDLMDERTFERCSCRNALPPCRSKAWTRGCAHPAAKCARQRQATTVTHTVKRRRHPPRVALVTRATPGDSEPPD
jgi:hypothetical protein